MLLSPRSFRLKVSCCFTHLALVRLHSAVKGIVPRWAHLRVACSAIELVALVDEEKNIILEGCRQADYASSSPPSGQPCIRALTNEIALKFSQRSHHMK